MNKPLIGILLDTHESGSFSTYPHHALRLHYFDAITSAGGIPIAIPTEKEHIEAYLNLIDALILPGGDGMDPAWYAEGHKPKLNPTGGLEFIKKITVSALEKDIPILGICAGMQIIVGVSGGQIQNIKASLKQEHYGTNKDEPSHSINIKKGTLLHQVIEKETVLINSAHIEEVVNLPQTLTVSATSPDGTIEAIEMPDKSFVLGLQWHPEHLFKTDKVSAQIFEEFVKKAQEHQRLHKK